MRTLVMGTTITGITASANRFVGAQASGETAVTTEDGVLSWIAPVAGTITYFLVQHDNKPGVGLTRTTSLYINGVESGTATVAFSGSGVSSSPTQGVATSISVSAGDRVCIVTYATGTTTTTGLVYTTFTFDTPGGQQGVVAGTAPGIPTTGTSYITMCGRRTATTTNAVEQTIPTAGSFKNVYVRLSAAPGVGTSVTFTLVKNSVDTALTVTITDSATTGNATSTVTVAENDLVYWKVTRSGTIASVDVALASQWDPDKFNSQILMFSSNTAISTASTQCNFHVGSASAWNAAVRSALVWYLPANFQTPNESYPPISRVVYAVARLGTAPGTGKSWTVTVGGLDDNSAAYASFSIADTATTNNSGQMNDPLIIVVSRALYHQWTPVSTPASSTVTNFSFVLYNGLYGAMGLGAETGRY